MRSTESAHARQTARPLLSLVAIAAVVAAIAPAPASAKGDPAVAALQVALHRKGLYRGTIDGVQSPATAAAVRAFARKHGLAPTSAPTALGVMAPRALGSRVLAEGATGADVAELQFELAWRGFPSGVFDGAFGTHLTGAVKRFQRWAGLGDDGIVGPATVAALHSEHRIAPPRLAWPITAAPLSGTFGPRGTRFHAGIDLVAAAGVPVHAAGSGRVVWAGVRTGWGLCVIVAHGGGVRTLYAHLSRAEVALGERVATGSTLGRVGATGEATGPHLHFEVRVRGAAIDPLEALP